MADLISRRDFLNGSLLAAGGVAVGASFPMRAFAESQRAQAGPLPASGELDPRMARGGNLPAAYEPAHWMIGQRLRFDKDSVTLQPGEDGQSGTFPIDQDDDGYDLVVVGSGLSGLSAVFHICQQHPNARVLILEANSAFGGNAGRDDGAPLAVPTSTAGSYIAAPDNGELYRALGIDWERFVVPAPVYSSFFDENTPHVLPGTRRWVLDSYGQGIDKMPYAPEILADLKSAKSDFVDWYDRAGGPTDPADESDPRFDYLDGRTLQDYLTRDKGFHPAVSDFYSVYAADALAGPTGQVSAHAAISFLSAEYFPIFTFPGGTNGLARGYVRHFIPGALSGKQAGEWLSSPLHAAALDDPAGRVRMRLDAVAVRADTGRDNASVTYFHDKRFRRVQAKTIVLAGQGYSSRRMTDHLIDEATRSAWRSFSYVPVVTVNVALRRADAVVQPGLGFGQYYWGSRDFVCFSVADWNSPQRTRADRSTVLTFYGGNWRAPDEMSAQRAQLLTTPFSHYEASLRADMQRLFAGTGFDFDRDVAGIFVYRWGHAMIYPTPGFAFGTPRFEAGKAVRTLAPRHLARRPLGRIAFAGQDVEGTPAVESAVGSGVRVAKELDRYL